jgi:hypothetical protein
VALILAATDNRMLTRRLSNPTVRRLAVGIMQSRVRVNSRMHQDFSLLKTWNYRVRKLSISSFASCSDWYTPTVRRHHFIDYEIRVAMGYPVSLGHRGALKLQMEYSATAIHSPKQFAAMVLRG